MTTQMGRPVEKVPLLESPVQEEVHLGGHRHLNLLPNSALSSATANAGRSPANVSTVVSLGTNRASPSHVKDEVC